MRNFFLYSFVSLFMIISYSCFTPPVNINQDTQTLPKYMDYTGNILSKSGEVLGSLDFFFEENSSFYLKIKTDIDAVTEVMDPEFEGLKFITVHYKPIESEFTGAVFEGNEKSLLFISKQNDQGLIAIVILTIDEQNNYSGKIDIRTVENFNNILLTSQKSNSGGGINPYILFILQRDARFIGNFLVNNGL